MLCYFRLRIQPRAILPQKRVSPVHPHPMCFLCSAGSSNLWEHISYFHRKKLWIPLEVRHGTKFPRICLESQCQATSVRASGQLPRLWLMWGELSGPAWVQGTPHNTCRHLQPQRALRQGRSAKSPHSNNSDVSRRSAEYRRPWGGGSGWPHLGWIWCTPSVRICLCVCVANHEPRIQP